MLFARICEDLPIAFNMLLYVVDIKIKGHNQVRVFMYFSAAGSLNAIVHILAPKVSIKTIQTKPKIREKISAYEPLFLSFFGWLLIALTEGKSIKATEFVRVAGNRMTGSAIPVKMPRVSNASELVNPLFSSVIGMRIVSMLCMAVSDKRFKLTGSAVFLISFEYFRMLIREVFSLFLKLVL